MNSAVEISEREGNSRLWVTCFHVVTESEQWAIIPMRPTAAVWESVSSGFSACSTYNKGRMGGDGLVLQYLP